MANKLILTGNLGKDPELRRTSAGKSVVNFSVATSERWTDKKTGEKKERTEWHNIVAFNNLADVLAKFLKQGSKVYLEGPSRTRSWEDKNGITRYTTELHVSEFEFLDSRAGSASTSGTPAAATHGAQAEAPGADIEYEDEVPF